LDVAAVFVGFSGVPEVDGFAFHAGGLLVAAVGGEDLAVQDQVGQTLLCGLFQGFVQVRGLLGEDFDDFVEVAVGGGARDAVISAQSGDIGTLAEPAQAQHGLQVAGQGPAVLAGAASAALVVEQAAHVLGEFPRDVEHGRICDHGEPLGQDLIFANPVLPRVPRPTFPGPPAHARPSPHRAHVAIHNKPILLRSPH
jgi:hypothetical protein